MSSAMLADKIRSNIQEDALELLQAMDKLAERVNDPKNNLTESETSQSIDYLRSDLLRLSGDLDLLRSTNQERANPSTEMASGLSLPIIMGGLTLGVLLEKLWGSDFLTR